MRAPEFWTPRDNFSRFLGFILSPIGWIYGATVAWKAVQAVPMRPHARVMCVGNLTVGGTGKTPITALIAQMLRAKGLNVFILSRGYGGDIKKATLVDPLQDTAAHVGDEPLMLAQTAPVIVARDRREGAALADKLGADVIVMDDGHQNFALAKDISIIVVDAQTGFANGRVLPAGPLREPVAQGLARADAVILVGEGRPALGAFSRPVLSSRIQPSDMPQLRGAKVFAFAGIGRPEKFYASLKALGSEIVGTQDYADHHAYTASEIARLRARARPSGAQLVTTEKDFVRLTAVEREGILFLPIHAEFAEPDQIDALLDRVVLEAIPPQQHER